jgi:hypothetical protein
VEMLHGNHALHLQEKLPLRLHAVQAQLPERSLMPVDQVVQKVTDMITRYGVAVMAIGGGDGTVPFSYTVGLTPHSHPELILLGGIKPEYARVTLTGMALRVIYDGRVYTPGQRHGDVLEGYDVIIAGPVEPAWDRLYPVSMAKRIYRAGRPLQVVYPDKYGTFPWEDGYEMRGQPLICPPPPGQ